MGGRFVNTAEGEAWDLPERPEAQEESRPQEASQTQKKSQKRRKAPNITPEHEQIIEQETPYIIETFGNKKSYRAKAIEYLNNKFRESDRVPLTDGQFKSRIPKIEKNHPPGYGFFSINTSSAPDETGASKARSEGQPDMPPGDSVVGRPRVNMNPTPDTTGASRVRKQRQPDSPPKDLMTENPRRNKKRRRKEAGPLSVPRVSQSQDTVVSNIETQDLSTPSDVNPISNPIPEARPQAGRGMDGAAAGGWADTVAPPSSGPYHYYGGPSYLSGHHVNLPPNIPMSSTASDDQYTLVETSQQLSVNPADTYNATPDEAIDPNLQSDNVDGYRVIYNQFIETSSSGGSSSSVNSG
ncbi:hypothetical protein ABW19_dt0205205 [Dactylella cylindrospora]|nr:hypothetical protein ABW19_dt0205205 [Dactylella cylindrospora]